MKCVLDMDNISEESYQAILKDFKKCFGAGFFVDWEISAVKEELEQYDVPSCNCLAPCESMGNTCGNCNGELELQ